MASVDVKPKQHSSKVQANASCCNFCGNVENLKRCAKCTQVYYCSKEHQIEDWKRHKKSCKKYCASQASAVKSQPVESDVTSSSQSNGAQKKQPVLVGNGFSGPVPPTTQQTVDAENKWQTSGNGAFNQGTSQSTSDLNSKLFNPGIGLSDECYKPRKFPKPDAYDASSIALHIYKHLTEEGYCVIDNLQDNKFARSLAKEVKVLYQSGKFVDGQLGGGKTSSVDSQKLVEKRIRGDEIIMLEGNEPTVPNICRLNLFLTSVVQKLSFFLKEQYTISGRTKVMVACYPGNGTGYACHVDNPNRDGRCITCLYYLNEGWDVTKQGGLLRLYPNRSSEFVDVEPILNRVLFFWSDRRSPHEVQPAYDTRYAVTIWYLDKTERHQAKTAQTEKEIDKAKVEQAMMNLRVKEEEEKKGQEARQAGVAREAVDRLTSEELESIAAIIKGNADPKEYLTSLGIAESIQSELIQRIQQSEKLTL